MAKPCCVCGGPSLKVGLGGLPFCSECYDKYMFVPSTLVRDGGYKDYFLKDQSMFQMVKEIFKI